MSTSFVPAINSSVSVLSHGSVGNALWSITRVLLSKLMDCYQNPGLLHVKKKAAGKGEEEEKKERRVLCVVIHSCCSYRVCCSLGMRQGSGLRMGVKGGDLGKRQGGDLGKMQGGDLGKMQGGGLR